MATRRHQLVHIVMANHDYEGNIPVHAFGSKRAAEAFADACRSYDKKQPECPEIADTPENDALWEKWAKKNKAWQNRHPARPHIGGDSWSVVSIPLNAQVPRSMSAKKNAIAAGL